MDARRSGRVALALIAGTTLLASGAQPATAAFPGRDGKLAFTRQGEVWTAQWSATGRYSERKLTNRQARNPAWSADGTRLAYNTKNGALETVSPTGTQRRTVIASRAYQPAWYPGAAGKARIAYVHVPAGTSKGDIWSVPAGGGKAQRLTTDGATSCGNSDPAVSPDGRTLAYLRREAGYRTGCAGYTVVLLDLVTKRRVLIRDVYSEEIQQRAQVKAGGPMKFSADGRSFVFDTTEAEHCWDMHGTYDLVSGETVAHIQYYCDWEPHVDPGTPTPSGGEANVVYYPDPAGVEDSWWLTVGANRHVVDAGSPQAGWGDMDVQPLR